MGPDILWQGFHSIARERPILVPPQVVLALYEHSSAIVVYHLRD